MRKYIVANNKYENNNIYILFKYYINKLYIFKA